VADVVDAAVCASLGDAVMTTTLAAIHDRADGRTAVRSATTRWSSRELVEAAAAVAREFERHDVRVAALAADNGPEWLSIDIGAQLAGVTLVPLPGFFSAEQIAHALQDSGADALIDAATAPPAGEFPNATSPAAAPFFRGLRLQRLTPVATPALPAGTAKISYTSGTTGRPKGVCLTQNGMDTVAQSLRSVVAELGVTRHLCVLPLATLLENVAGVYAPLQDGAEVIVPSLRETGLAGANGFDVSTLLRCLDTYRPESIILLPQLLAALVAAIEQGAKRPSDLRFIAVGGAHVSPALLERADRVALPVYEGYGLTECCSVVSLNSPAARRAGSVGRPLPHARVTLDAQAEIHVGGPAVCGYVGSDTMPTSIATGDLGRFDADGFLHVNGRRKNVFITSFGRNVSPEWVETELIEQAPIGQAAVFGEARPWNVAVIAPRAANVTPAEVQAAIERVNRRLPDYARIGDWLCAAEPFTQRNGLATANGRNRRTAIWQTYGNRIDSFY